MMKQELANRAKRRNDLLLILVLLAVALVSFLLYTVFVRTDGNTVKVTVDGEVFGVYPLAKDRTVEIVTGKNGEHKNILCIANGEAYMQDADCPDRICVAHRAIAKNGENIVCLPHKIIVTIEGEAS